MVAKIAYGSSLYGVISYNHNKVEAGTASVLHTHNMINNMSGSEKITFRQILRSFEDYLPESTKLKTPIAHFSLNPSPQDKLSDEKLIIVSDSYMGKMGYRDQPYIIYKHQDLDREHIHIVSVRIKEDGEKIPDSYDYERSVMACRELEKEYGLKQIKDQTKEESIYYLKKVEYGRSDLKRQISNAVKSLMKDYDFQSIGEYNSLLSCFNINCRQVKGEDPGNLYQGIIYNAMNAKGEPVGPPIKSSRLGKFAGYDALIKKIEKIIRSVKKNGLHVPYAKSKITAAMKVSSTKEQFIEALKIKNMDVVLRQNEQGRIYGATFIDHDNRVVFNGSRLGKEFSATIFNDLFTRSISKTEEKVKNGKTDIITDMQDVSCKSDSASIDEIFGTFYIHNSGYDAEQEAFLRKLKRKKKRKKHNL